MSENKKASNSGNLKLLIMGGGAGTRLWPMSRVNQPKQLQPLVGEQSSLQHMVGILLEGFSPDDIFISTARGYEDEVLEQLPQLSADSPVFTYNKVFPSEESTPDGIKRKKIFSASLDPYNLKYRSVCQCTLFLKFSLTQT